MLGRAAQKDTLRSTTSQSLRNTCENLSGEAESTNLLGNISFLIHYGKF